jgi:ribosomal protein L18E
VRAEAFSAGAKQKIESAGGTCELIERKPAPVVRHKNKAKKK